MTNRRDRLRRGLPCIGPARSLGRHADGGWWSFRSMHQLRPKGLIAIEAPRIRVHANLPRRRSSSGIAAGEALPDVSRCLAFMSLFEVVRAAFSTPHAHGFLDHRRKPMDEPNLRIARGDAHTVLFREQRRDVPNARSRTGRRRALRPPARSVRRFDQKARPKLPHLFRTDPLFCTRFRQELRMQRPSLASFDARTV
jgi:hypothetical protein